MLTIALVILLVCSGGWFISRAITQEDESYVLWWIGCMCACGVVTMISLSYFPYPLSEVAAFAGSFWITYRVIWHLY